MATSALCGSEGSVSGIGTTTEVFYWEVTQHQDAIESTSFDSGGWKERIACLKGATGSIKAYTPIVTGPLTSSFKIGSHTISGNIRMHRVTCDTPVEGVVTFNGEFTFTGAVSGIV